MSANGFMNVLDKYFIFECFEDFRKKHNNNNSFQLFENDFLKLEGKSIFKQYPVLKKILDLENYKVKDIQLSIKTAFNDDNIELHANSLLHSVTDRIEDIKIGLGDFHNGKSTAVLQLSHNSKIVYKPTDGDITRIFHNMINWINGLLPLENYKYNILNKGKYHWLEFINNTHCNTVNEISDYYERAGYLLCTTYLLNGTDFHHENVIANGMYPVIIDHETIIQPKLSENLKNYFKTLDIKNQDTVIASFLLPNHERTAANMPLGSCGFGYHKEKIIQTFQKESVNEFTDDWKIITKFENYNLQKDNLPALDGKTIYPEKYLNELINGFEKCYCLFLKNKSFLLSDNSPLKGFENQNVRFIWRPTRVYAKIHNQMKLANNLKNFDTYKKKITDYLSVAYKNVPEDSDIRLLLKSEVIQMLGGDIPLFKINSSSRDLSTEFGTIKNFFELSCMENIERKVKKLSLDDLDCQKSLIIESFL